MGACLSCLGSRDDSSDRERAPLLPDDPYNQTNHNYGSWNQATAPPQNVTNQEDVRREQEAMDNIMRWASDQIVEIFPHQQLQQQQRNLVNSLVMTNGNGSGGANGDNGMSSSTHQDILLSMIPGDKSKRSIRIYPASRPSSRSTQQSDAQLSKVNGSTRSHTSSVLVKLNVDLP